MGIQKSKMMDQEDCRVRMVHLDHVKYAQENMIPEKDLHRLSLTFKVLSDPTRLKIVMSLLNQECACVIWPLFWE